MLLLHSFPKFIFNKSVLRNETIKFTYRTLANKPENNIIHINSQKINYVKIGEGPKKVLCFPGALGTIWTDFKPQLDSFDQSKFTTIAWDPPGHGNSRPPERKLSSNFYEEDADTAYLFMKELGLNSFTLLGWSDGGISSMIVAAKYPQVVEKLVIWGSNSYVLPSEMMGYEKIRNINNWSERARTPFLEIYGAETFQKMQNGWVDAMVEISKKGGDICSPLLKNIQCPTLILHGDKDPLVDLEHPNYLLENIKGAKLHRFPDGKHNIHIRYAKEFNERVMKFLLNND